MTSGFNQQDKQLSVQELAALIPDGASVALGGSFLHRGPFAFVRELVRQKKTGLEIIKQSPGYDIDLLCRAGVATRARTGIVAMEGNFGLAPNYRKAIESGKLQLEEHACATLTAGLRAAAYGVPFQPCAGIEGSHLIDINGWHRLDDPYGSGKPVWVIPAVQPDFAVIHANEIDSRGNVRVLGTSHWDRIMSRAARSVLVVAERQVSAEVFEKQPEVTLIPYFMVQAYAIAPHGAWPGSCWPHYEIDYPAVQAYLEPGADALQAHLDAAPEVSQEHAA
ncbi:CoA transferase subunit A [Bordetella petrii]|uniref:Glutaconate CoA transferase subunit A n=1 Tax=Bordetella petrii (strain ATCC BAA-461 / DSM 12804 / CCUG 43448 / CIP 107267 / Se-1111R) TaxID=340100 RepID=A9I070_BORPD|nr:CoA transferase [Bordetella petrii]CAP44021.1 putative glutaconate CoA transferase subunit A [Bordetella petrii]